MINKISAICLLSFCLFAFSACQNADKQGSAKTANKTTTTETTTAAAPSVNADIKPILQRLLPLCQKVEYVFYKGGISFSTELGDQRNILAYYNYISDKEVPKHNCKFDGGAVFRGAEGDIIMTTDFVLVDGKCRSIVLVADNKSYHQEITEGGMQHLMYFYNIDQQQGGTIVPK